MVPSDELEEGVVEGIEELELGEGEARAFTAVPEEEGEGEASDDP